MFEELLQIYRNRASFDYDHSSPYKTVCNAPSSASGIYLIYGVHDSMESLLYIGSSGQRDKAGQLKTRIGGMKDRLINGYHPHRFSAPTRIKRYLAFPAQMRIEKIPLLRIYWWVTYDNISQDFPTDIELKLHSFYVKQHNKLPAWHIERLKP